MKRKQLWKVLGTGALALSLCVSPVAGISAFAEEVDQTGDSTTDDGQEAAQAETDTEGDAADVKEGGSVEGLNPLQDETIPAQGTETDPDYQPEVPAYEDVEIPVWGFTEDATVYSVDVEWGAMTFQWENSSWDPKTHKSKTGAGWKVYDSTQNKALDVTEDAINEIKVTNHSNAGVWATLAYASEAAYTPDTTGDFAFSKGTETTDTDVLTAAAGDVPAYLTLETADNGLGTDGAGKPTVGKAYFMPDGLATSMQTDGGITKWTKIGTITVGIKTEQPTAENTKAPEVTEP